MKLNAGAVIPTQGFMVEVFLLPKSGDYPTWWLLFSAQWRLHTLLTHLGYRVSIHPANVHGAEGPEHIKLENHAAIIAEGLSSESNPNGRWWVDVGFGDALHEQMPLMNTRR
jgi:hypothetical protein